MNHKKLYTISLSCIFSISIICMETQEIVRYKNTCEAILAKRNQELANYKETVCTNNLQEESDKILQQLNAYKEKIIKKTHTYLDQIKTNHAISGEKWQCFLSQIAIIDKAYNEIKNNPQGPLYHDAALPENSFALIMDELINRGISPLRLIIRTNNTIPYLYEIKPMLPISMFHAYSPESDIHNTLIKPEPFYSFNEFENTPEFLNNKPCNIIWEIKEKQLKHGEITVNVNKLLALDPKNQHAACIRMVEEIESSRPACLTNMLESLLTNTEKTITNSIEYKQLITHGQKLSVFLPSLRSLTNAQHMLLMTSECYSPEIFTINDYKLLSFIHKKWLALSWIKQQKTTPSLPAVTMKKI